MRVTEDGGPWVVYVMTVRRKGGMAEGVNAVCGQAAWDQLERAQPGHQPLVRGGIVNEGEAEQLARTSPPPAPRPIPAAVAAMA